MPSLTDLGRPAFIAPDGGYYKVETFDPPDPDKPRTVYLCDVSMDEDGASGESIIEGDITSSRDAAAVRATLDLLAAAPILYQIVREVAGMAMGAQVRPGLVREAIDACYLAHGKGHLVGFAAGFDDDEPDPGLLLF